jgi:hypothetical protein
MTLALSLLLWVTGNLHAADSGSLYLPSADAMADVDRAMVSARDADKLVLVVMGANWCHDSRALASRLYQQPLKSLIEEHYETVFVDVGYLDQGREVISSIGPPVYYATPTVLIVDPVSRRLVNADDRHQWGHADTISMEESVDYFVQMSAADRISIRAEQDPAGELQELLSAIDSFERLQAERLYAAYRIIGPMLEAYKAGEAPEQFDAYWEEVRAYRMRVPEDIDALRREAKKRVAAGESDIRLNYPEYAKFTGETPP